MSLISRDPFQLTGRYATRNRWEVLNGPGDSRVTGRQIIKDENLTNAWSDKVILITGVSAGIGVETVRALASNGATIYGTARNLTKAKDAIGSTTISTNRIHLLHMDHTSLSSVPSCGAEFFAHSSHKLHILINNAAYNGWLAYGSSKTATIYLINQIERLYGSRGLHGYSVHPGAFESPNLQIHPAEEMKVFAPEGGNRRMQKYLSSLEQACATSVYGAASSELEEKGGLYLEGASISEQVSPRKSGEFEYGYAGWAFDEAKEQELWEMSGKMVGI